MLNKGNKMKYTVVIPEHNEKQNLKETIDNIKSTQKNCDHIEHINDEARLGTSYSRHLGIFQSKNDVIITIDAHMRFEDGALDKMAEHITKSEIDTVCCLMTHYNETFDFTKAKYTGAKLLWKQTEEDSRKCMSAVWGNNEVGEIPAIMGGCYGFKKSTYEKLGSPWSLGYGWGYDEETLSLSIRLIGGNVELLPYACAHLYVASKSIENSSKEEELIKLWYNRLRNIYYLPLSDKDRLELINYMLKDNSFKNNKDIIMAELDKRIPQIDIARDILISNQTVSFEDYAKKWIIGY